MLTATYTLVAMSVEQASVRLGLQSLQHILNSSFVRQSALSAAEVGYACDALQRLYHSCQWRKVDMFLVPAIRGSTEQADALLHELDALRNAAGHAIATVAERVDAAAIDTEASVAQFCDAISAFCDATLKWLEREEGELFPLARAVISGEAWFSIANHMLAHDAHKEASKPPRRPLLVGNSAMPDTARAPHERARQQGFAATFAE